MHTTDRWFVSILAGKNITSILSFNLNADRLCLIPTMTFDDLLMTDLSFRLLGQEVFDACGPEAVIVWSETAQRITSRVYLARFLSDVGVMHGWQP